MGKKILAACVFTFLLAVWSSFIVGVESSSLSRHRRQSDSGNDATDHPFGEEIDPERGSPPACTWAERLNTKYAGDLATSSSAGGASVDDCKAECGDGCIAVYYDPDSPIVDLRCKTFSTPSLESTFDKNPAYTSAYYTKTCVADNADSGPDPVVPSSVNGTTPAPTTSTPVPLTNTTASDQKDEGDNTVTVTVVIVILVIALLLGVVVFIYLRIRKRRMAEYEKKAQIQMSSTTSAGVYVDLTSAPPEEKEAEKECLKKDDE